MIWKDYFVMCAAGEVQDKSWGQAPLKTPSIPADGDPCSAAWPLEGRVAGP